MGAISFNHVSVHADDLCASAVFYERLFGMQRIPTPTFAFPVQWLRLGDQQLHLFTRPDVDAPRFHHVGLNVDDFESVYGRVQELGVQDESAFFSALYGLPDGSVQLYVRDPAGNLVEIDWPDACTLSPRIRARLVRLSDTVTQTADALDATLYLPRSA